MEFSTKNNLKIRSETALQSKKKVFMILYMGLILALFCSFTSATGVYLNITMTGYNTPAPFKVTATSNDTGLEGWRAFDGNIINTSGWGPVFATTFPQNLTIDLGSAYYILPFSIYVTDKQISGDYITFTTVNAYYLAAVSPFIRNSNNEDMIISKGYLGYCGETFIVGRFSRNV
jgi:hypothetical protein